MRRMVLAGGTALMLCAPALAQHWIPPRPGPNGIDICSGWDTAAAQQQCYAKEAAGREKEEEAKRIAEDQRRASRDAADAKIRDERSKAARLDAERDEEERKRAAIAAADLEKQRDEALKRQIQAETDAAIAAERVREAEQARAAAAQEALGKRQKLIAKMKAEAEADAQATARAEAADPFKRVDALDLRVSPEDFVSKPIKLVGLQCYAPSADGRRCFDGENLVLLQAANIGPDNVVPELDRSCSAVRIAMTDAACRWTARFILDDYRTEKTEDGNRRTILLPKSVELTR